MAVETVEEILVEETVEVTIEELVVDEIESGAIKTDETVSIVDELSGIVPGLARPESPALPEDAVDNSDTNEAVAADSDANSAESVVAPPVETVATPE